MKHLAYVVTNYGTGEDAPPMLGAIRVVCPTVWGFTEGIPKDIKSQDDMLKYGVLSPSWILPVGNNSNDMSIPDAGDYVVIEQVVSTEVYVWVGVVPHVAVCKNPFVKNSKTNAYDIDMPGVDSNAKIDSGKYKTRVLGTKCGTAIVMEDTWIEERKDDAKRASRLKITVGGKSHIYEDRVGPEIVIDAKEDEETTTIVVQNIDGSLMSTILVNNKKDEGSIEITDNAGQVFKMDAKKDEELISITDKAGQTFQMNSKSGETGIVFTDKESQTVTLDAANKEVIIKTGSGKITLDASSSDVTVKATNCIIDASSAIKLGGTGAVDDLVKGTTFKAKMATLLTALQTHTHPAVTTATIGPTAAVGVVTITPSPGLASATNPVEGSLSTLCKTK